MGFTGMPAGISLGLFAPRQQQEAELCRVLCQAGIIPSLLSRGSWGWLLEAAAGLPPCLCLQEGARAGCCRAGHGGPGGVWVSQEPSCILQMVQWIRDPGRDGALFLLSEPAAQGRAHAAGAAVGPSIQTCPQAHGLGPPLPLAVAVSARGSLERGLGWGVLRGAV